MFVFVIFIIIIIIVHFVYFSLTCFHSLFLFCFLIGFLSSFSLPFFPFSVLCLFRCFLLSFSFFASFYCFSFCFLDLPSYALSSLRLRISFPSPFSSSFLPLSLFLFFVPVVVYSSFSSRPSFSPSFSVFCSLSAPLVFPFLPPLSSPPISLFLFRLRFFPSTLFLPSCCLFFLPVCPRSSLMCSSLMCFSFPFVS